MNALRFGIRSFLVLATSCFCLGPILAADLPEGAGKEVIEQECTACHSADRIAGQKKTKSDWQDTVDRMISKGAGLSSSEYDTLIAYLVKNFSKDEEPAKIDKVAKASQSH
jgi:mono/diheme cytochrome c family protein